MSTAIPIVFSPEISVDGTAPVVIIGPNGSGKTRFGRKIATMNEAEIISALRNIELTETLPVQALPEAENRLEGQKNETKTNPWSQSNDARILFVKLIAENVASAVEFQDAALRGASAAPRETSLIRLSTIWSRLFDGRSISFRDSSPKTVSEYSHGGSEYPAQQMSDGERVALYLLARVLDAKTPIIVVDEPEVHLHSRLAIRLWDELQSLRPDCRFVYITHDLPFAMSRDPEQFILMKPDEDLEAFTLSPDVSPAIREGLLAAASVSIFARRIVFCEGTESSVDQAFYRAWFHGRDTAVVPVRSCLDVMRCTKTFRERGLITGVEALGIIDSDYWSEDFLNSIPKGVFALPFHEIESLFVQKGLFVALGVHLEEPREKVCDIYEDISKIARAKFTGSLFSKQVSERFRCRCENQMRKVMNSLWKGDDIDEMRAHHCDALASHKWQETAPDIFDAEKERLAAALTAEAEDFLFFFPGKTYLPNFTAALRLKKDEYIDLIVDALQAQPNTELASLGEAISTELEAMLPDRTLEEQGVEGK